MASERRTTSGDREGVGRGNFRKKKYRKLKFWAKISCFLSKQNFSQKDLENVEKMQFFGVREGVKRIFFSISLIGWSENGPREGHLLEGKSAYGYPPLPSPPSCPRMTVGLTGQRDPRRPRPAVPGFSVSRRRSVDKTKENEDGEKKHRLAHAAARR